jgi:nucleoside-diphosphate-sugar epimerase
MKIAIIGCGWVGERLAKFLSLKDHHVIATTTSPEKIIPLQIVAKEVHLLDFNSNPDFSILEYADVAIFSMPISRADWHEGFPKLDNKFAKTILFSSTGIYPKENKIFTEEENSNLRADILASEKLVRKSYPDTIILRFGGLMGDHRSLQKMFKNRTPENLQKVANYIHFEDILEVVDLVIKSEIKGETYNVVAPEHPTVGEILKRENNVSLDQKDAISHRIISSDHLIQDFNYTFIHPNPKDF